VIKYKFVFIAPPLLLDESDRSIPKVVNIYLQKVENKHSAWKVFFDLRLSSLGMVVALVF
jgi:hypothetical protein